MAKSQLTVWTLNGSRFVGKTPDEKPQTVAFLEDLAKPGAKPPDVICIQDFRKSLTPLLKRAGLVHHAFCPMTDHLIWGKREEVGVILASRFKLDDVKRYTLWGNGVLKKLKGVGDDNQRIRDADGTFYEADRLVLDTEDRIVVAATVMKPETPGFRIATTHGFWTRGGVPTPEQRQSTADLCTFLEHDGFDHDGVILIGDLNLDKEGEVLRALEQAGARDHLPSDVATTLASHHPAAKLGLKPDRIMQFGDEWEQHRYDITGVTLHDVGSDHLLLEATVELIGLPA